MRRSVSNLAWGNIDVSDLAPVFQEAGIEGVEIAPTLVWPDAPRVPVKEVSVYRDRWNDFGIQISGVQSLLYGHPSYQVFDRSTWPSMLKHLRAMVEIARGLGAGIAVFGSPRNRIKDGLDISVAHQVFAEFLTEFLPVLEENEVVLTLEPNAPEYGADYLLHYSDAVYVSHLVGSSWIQPQIDTGCLTLVGEDLITAICSHKPAHFHVSTPHLRQPPGDINHDALNGSLNENNFRGWVVLEMLQDQSIQREIVIESAKWLTRTYYTH